MAEQSNVMKQSYPGSSYSPEKARVAGYAAQQRVELCQQHVELCDSKVNSATKSWRAFANAHVPVGASLKLRLRPSDTVRMMENGNMLYDQRVFHSPSGVAAHARRLCKRNLICNG